MPIQAPSWTEFLSCPICYNEFAVVQRLPISLGCGHTICRVCLGTLHNRQCPFDQTTNTTDVVNLPINSALLQLVSNGTGGNGSSSNNNSSGRNSAMGGVNSAMGGGDCVLTQIPPSVRKLSPEDLRYYKISKECIENLALHLRSFATNFGNPLSRPMQRKLVTLINCQLMEEEGRVRALRAARSLGERTVTELILQHQNPQQLSSNLWASVRSRGCQFLGPSMQEEVLKLVLLALQDGAALSRKVLVMYVVQRLEPHFPQASKTSIGHVVQLLYRASCFKVSKRDGDSSLMQLKEEFRTYEALRREHDAQIVQIATEAGLRIAPDQWSSLLYGDTLHKSHMQSIIDKLQTPSSFAQSIQELVIALQRTGDPANLEGLRTHLKDLASIDPSLENAAPTWEELAKALDAVRQVVVGLVEFMQQHGNRKLTESAGGQGGNPNTKFKISLCRDLTMRRVCPRGTSCTFAHSEEELERYRAKSRKNGKSSTGVAAAVAALTNAGLSNGGVLPTSKKETYQNHHGHHGGVSAAAAAAASLLHSGDDLITPVSTVAPSSMRYTATGAHNKSIRTSIGNGNGGRSSGLGFNADVSTSVHAGHGSLSQGGGGHHIRSLHHSPISPTNVNVATGVAQTSMNIVGQHRYEPKPYALTYGASPPRMPAIVQTTRNSNVVGSNVVGANVVSTRTYPVLALQTPAMTQAQPQTQQTQQPPPPQSQSQSNLNNINASKLGQQTSTSTSTNAVALSGTNKGLYNYYEFYNINAATNVYNAASNNPNASEYLPYNNGAGLGVSGGGVTKLGPAINSLWEQHHHQQQQQQKQQPQTITNTTGIDIINSTFGGGHNSNHIYNSAETVNSVNATVNMFYSSKKQNNSNIVDNNKGQTSATQQQQNAVNTAENFNFSNAYASNNGDSSSNNSGNDRNTSNNFTNYSYSTTNNSNIMSPENMLNDTVGVGVGRASSNHMSPHTYWNSCNIPSRPNAYQETERDHAASVAAAEAFACDNLLNQSPVLPTYKGYNPTPVTTHSTANDFFENWSTGGVNNTSSITGHLTNSTNLTAEHSLLEDQLNSSVGQNNISSYPVFSNATEEKLQTLNLPQTTVVTTSMPPDTGVTDSLIGAFVHFAGNCNPVADTNLSDGNGSKDDKELAEDMHKNCVITDAMTAAIWGNGNSNALIPLASSQSSNVCKKPGIINTNLNEHQQMPNSGHPDMNSEIFKIGKNVWSLEHLATSGSSSNVCKKPGVAVNAILNQHQQMSNSDHPDNNSK